MKILKLYGHKNNTGGIVNLQNGLQPHCKISDINYLYFRTGKIQGSKFFSNPLIRFIDQFITYLYYPIFLRLKKPDVVELNSSLVPGAFKRDFIYAKLTKMMLPKAKRVLFNHGWNFEFKTLILTKNKSKIISYFNTFHDIIVLANSFKKELQEEMNIKMKKIHVITTGINLSEYSDYKISTNSSTDLSILFLSRIEKTKGVDEFINSVPIILNIYPKTKFNIAGTGKYLDSVKSNEVYKKYKSNVTLNGYVRGQNKMKLFQKNDIFTFPSYGEGCPVSVLEALAVGLPIIYTEVGALPDILKNRVNGIFIEKKSVSDLSNAIIELIENHQLRDSIIANNIVLSKKFDLSIIHKQLETIYIQK